MEDSQFTQMHSFESFIWYFLIFLFFSWYRYSLLRLGTQRRQTTGNGTLYFPPFLGQYYRADVHEGVYRCRASNQAGTILSRDVHITAGKEILYYNFMPTKRPLSVHLLPFSYCIALVWHRQRRCCCCCCLFLFRFPMIWIHVGIYLVIRVN